MTSSSPAVAERREPIIKVRGLRTAFGTHVVHDHLDLDIYPGEVLGIVGGSGTGKSVLMRNIIMLMRPAAGSIEVFGTEIVGIDRTGADAIRRRFGVMFQQGALFSSLTVLENISVPLQEHTDLSPERIRDVAMLKLALSGLQSHAATKYPGELSGGMLKRAAVARALALDPELLFLDEPSAGLDPVGASELDELILQLKESLGLAVVMVTHDLDSLWRTTDRVAFLGEKRILEVAPMEVLARSPHPLLQNYFTGPRARVAERQYR